MIGIDTNIIIRYIVQDDVQQSRKATRFMENKISTENPGFINHVVLCEIAWVLSGAYGFSKENIIRVVQSMLTANEIVVFESDLVWKTMADFEDGDADFSDYLIANINVNYGCNETVTFDKKALQHPLFAKCSLS